MTSDELVAALEAKRPEMLRIARAILRRSGMEADAEDFLQDATIKILAGLQDERYTFDEGVGGMFQTAIINLIHDHRAKERTREHTSDEYTRIYQPDSQAQIQQRERLKIEVALALGQLDSRTREIVELVWMEGNNWTRTARLLKCSKRDVQAGLERALPILQQALARYDHRHRVSHVSSISALLRIPGRETFPTETAAA
jgi:RNA polymerase sigma factor (sigma-70 family)